MTPAAAVASGGLEEVDPRIPVRLLTGPAAGGRAAVLRHLLTAGDGRRRAHVVADPALLDGLPRGTRRPDPDTAILGDGTVGHVMRGDDVVAALNRLHLCKLGLTETRLDYDEVLVEVPSGLSPLVLVYQLQTDARLALTFRFEAIAAVVDAAHARRHLGRESPDAAAIARADLLILDGADGLPGGDAAAVRAEIAGLNPFAPLLTARRGAVAPSLVMDGDPFDAPAGGELAGLVELSAAAIEGPAKRAVRCLVNNPLNDARSNAPSAQSPVRAAYIRLTGNADIFRVAATVAAAAERAGAGLYRLKCITAVPTTEHPVVFQYVDGAFIPPAWGRPGERRETRLIAVGRDLDCRRLMADVAACWWDAAAIARGEMSPF